MKGNNAQTPDSLREELRQGSEARHYANRLTPDGKEYVEMIPLEWAEEVLKSSNSNLLNEVEAEVIGKNIKPLWSNANADSSNDESNFCERCDFLPGEDYEKCECVIKNELRAEQRSTIQTIRKRREL